MSLHWFDLAAGIFLAGCVIYSSLRGFVKELFTVSGWVAGYFGSIALHPYFSPFVKKVIKTTVIADLISFFLLFAFVYLGVRLLGLFAQKKLGLGKIPAEINHGAGAIVGFAKWGFFLAIFLSPLNYFPDMKASLMKDSLAAEVIISASKQVTTGGNVEDAFASKRVQKKLQQIKSAALKETPGPGAAAPKKPEAKNKGKKTDSRKDKADRKAKSPQKPPTEKKTAAVPVKTITPPAKQSVASKSYHPPGEREEMDALIDSLQ